MGWWGGGKGRDEGGCTYSWNFHVILVADV